MKIALGILMASVMIFSFQNCGGNEDGDSAGATMPSNLEFDQSASMTVDNHHISSSLIDCSRLNPDSIRSLDTRIIHLLGSQLSNGLTLHHHYSLLVGLGYSGMLGKGEGNAWLSMDPARRAAMDAQIAYAVQTEVANFKATKALGYKGVFTCGGGACFKSGGCDEYGRRL